MTTKLCFLEIWPAPTSQVDVLSARMHFEASKGLMTALGGMLTKADQGTSISLEIVAKSDQISFVVVAPADLQSELQNQLYAALPTARITPHTKLSIFDGKGELAGTDLQFSPDDAPIKDNEFSGVDPLQPLLEMLAGVDSMQRVCVQLVLRHSKESQGLLAATANFATDVAKLLITGRSEEKTSKEPGKEPSKTESVQLRANLRVLALANSATAAKNLVRQVVAAYQTFTIPGKSSLLHKQPKVIVPWMRTMLHRQSQSNTSFLVTPAEATNIWHTPLNVRANPRIQALGAVELAIPDGLPTSGIQIGTSSYRESNRPIWLSPADRLRHVYLIGQTGTGKSSLFQSAILQDITNGDGCCFIDPHGEVIDWLLPRIPPERAKDVLLFDPSDPAAIIGLNLLEWRTPHERDLIIQELIALFYKLFDPNHTGLIGPQFEHWLRNAALTITEPQVRGTLVDIPRLFTDKAFQSATVKRSQHWAVQDFWNNQMAQTADFHKSEMLNYFTSKFGSFLGNSVMHDILSQPHSAFDMRSIMDNRKILLVNLSKGRLGSLNSQLLGAIVMAKIQMAAMSRADTPSNNRPPFYVYIDEFQNIVTDSFAGMLSEIRKYGVGLHLAHQYIDQLPESVQQAVAGNIGTLLAFRIGHRDASWLEELMSPLSVDDLTGIAPYHFHMRGLAFGQLVPPFTVKSLWEEKTLNSAIEHAIRERVVRYSKRTRKSSQSS